ncbi:hypothetical protein E3J61_00195 [Candidatus Dependentiae bacterium]|nr:MAG: hypothetical protein E3J61_00195 [Candidatus Dependentiae bacterium]
MNRLKLKPGLYTVFFLIAAQSGGIQASNGEERLKELHRRRIATILHDHPEVASKFIQKAAQKGKATTTKVFTPVPAPTHPLMPEEPKPVVKAEPAPKPAVKPEPPKPVVKPWMTDNDLSDLNTIFTRLETNSMGVYACLDAFFCKKNCQSYQTHVNCMKSQIAYLQTNLIQKFPQAETPERRQIFIEFQKITATLERAEMALFAVINQKYPASAIGVMQLGKQFASAKPLLATWKKQADQAVNTLRGLLRPEMLPRLNKLRNAINKMFDFGKNMGIEIIGIMRHRLQT